MNSRYRVDFERLEWQSPMDGVRHKFIDRDGLRIRLVEYSSSMPPHWCERGHHGYLIEGRMEIEYAGSKVAYGPGDGISIPDGPDHRHRGVVLTGRALVFFVERP